MKKLFIAMCMMLVSATSFAQKGQVEVGIHGGFILDSPNNLGIGANVGYMLMSNVRGVAEFNYFLKKDYHTMWDANLNIHYLIHFGQLTVYPLAGGGLMDRTYEDTYLPLYDETISGGIFSDRYFGANAGAGMDYPVNDWLKVNAEVKVQFVQNHDPRPVASVGVAVKL